VQTRAQRVFARVAQTKVYLKALECFSRACAMPGDLQQILEIQTQFAKAMQEAMKQGDYKAHAQPLL